MSGHSLDGGCTGTCFDLHRKQTREAWLNCLESPLPRYTHTLAEKINQASLGWEMEARSHVVSGAPMSVGGGAHYKLEIWDYIQEEKTEKQGRETGTWPSHPLHS